MSTLSSNPLHGKTAFVTGASRGIGRAIALRLARDGAHVAINYGASRDEAEAVAAEIRALGVQSVAIGADLGSVASIVQAYVELDRFLLDANGRPGFDILVNNAGVAVAATPADTTEAQFDHLFDVNVKGVFFAIQQAAPRLNEGGRIVNISSLSTRVATPGLAAYAASKGALETLTLQLAPEFAARGITVNNVSPGAIETVMNTFLQDEAGRAAILQSQAIGRVGQPEDIADAVAFVASHDGRWLTGTTLDASGGSHL
ncbi:SDR family oxidoreductase [Lysobacter sp. ESA13C]|uniref:SDR family oxidoreductase n=1 Tax=Lysobacter sp. ESA13C TaxID=2862676 RepID=UPI001CBFA4A0